MTHICVRELGYHWPQLCLVTSATKHCTGRVNDDLLSTRIKMVAISQTTFWNAFSWITLYEFRSTFHWVLFLGDQTSDIPTLVHIMAWRRPGDKPLSEPMKFSLLTRICVPWSQRVTHMIRPILNESLHIVLQKDSSFINPCWVTLYQHLIKMLSVHKVFLKM